ncbi:hypothetical protein BDV06DRAFT_230889 [Aspergillus oleicola]
MTPDIHLSNALIKLPSIFDDLSVKELYEKYGEAETIPIARCYGELVPANASAKAVKTLFLGKNAGRIELSDAHQLLVTLARPSHPYQNPDPSPPGNLGNIGMKPIFSIDHVPEDEIIAQHVDVLGPMPLAWWERWEARPQFLDEEGRPTESYKINQWPPLEEWLEAGVQQWRRKRGNEIENEERPTAEEVLQSEWMVNWALPDYERR